MLTQVFVLSAGEIIAPGAGLLFTVADDWTNSGGTFTHSNGKVTFDTVDEAIVTGDTTFYDLRIRDASKIVTFAVGSTQTVEGDFDVRANNPNIKIGSRIAFNIIAKIIIKLGVSVSPQPSFTKAATPNKAKFLYEYFTSELAKQNIEIKTGEFGAMMDVSLINDGPVTFCFR